LKYTNENFTGCFGLFNIILRTFDIVRKYYNSDVEELDCIQYGGNEINKDPVKIEVIVCYTNAKTTMYDLLNFNKFNTFIEYGYNDNTQKTYNL
jgi:hypothetical protein